MTQFEPKLPSAITYQYVNRYTDLSRSKKGSTVSLAGRIYNGVVPQLQKFLGSSIDLNSLVTSVLIAACSAPQTCCGFGRTASDIFHHLVFRSICSTI